MKMTINNRVLSVNSNIMDLGKYDIDSMVLLVSVTGGTQVYIQSYCPGDNLKHNCTVDWGDGYIGTYYYTESGGGTQMIRTYTNSGIYTIKISGYVAGIICEYNSNFTKGLLKIIKWGKLGLKYCLFYYCYNLTEISEDLYGGLGNIISNDSIFAECIKLKSIPYNLFKYNSNIDFDYAFYDCTSLTGLAPKLWEIPGATGIYCFYNCTGLSNYSEIPNNWKGV